MVLDDIAIIGSPGKIEMFFECAERGCFTADGHSSWIGSQVDYTVFNPGSRVFGMVLRTFSEENFVVRGAICKPHPMTTNVSLYSDEIQYKVATAGEVSLSTAGTT